MDDEYVIAEPITDEDMLKKLEAKRKTLVELKLKKLKLKTELKNLLIHGNLYFLCALPLKGDETPLYLEYICGMIMAANTAPTGMTLVEICDILKKIKNLNRTIKSIDEQLNIVETITLKKQKAM